jgi:hypothetical protein
MKNLIIASAIVLASAGVSLAGATLEYKGTNSQGSLVGTAASEATGNGDWTGGKGTGAGTFGAGDQTTSPASRAAAVHSLQSIDHGSSNGAGWQK